MKTLAARLIRLRKAKSLSASEVARRLSVSTSTYREWEYGRAIKGEPYIKLAQVFEVSLSELLLGEEAGRQEIKRRITEIETIAREVKNFL